MSLQDQLDRITELTNLPEGWWDGLGVPLSDENAAKAEEIVRTVHHVYPEYPPSIFPMENGGASLEWNSNTTHFSLEVEDGVLSACFVDTSLNCSTIEDIGSVEGVVVLLSEWVTGAR